MLFTIVPKKIRCQTKKKEMIIDELAQHTFFLLLSLLILIIYHAVPILVGNAFPSFEVALYYLRHTLFGLVKKKKLMPKNT